MTLERAIALWLLLGAVGGIIKLCILEEDTRLRFDKLAPGERWRTALLVLVLVLLSGPYMFFVGLTELRR